MLKIQTYNIVSQLYGLCVLCFTRTWWRVRVYIVKMVLFVERQLIKSGMWQNTIITGFQRDVSLAIYILIPKKCIAIYTGILKKCIVIGTRFFSTCPVFARALLRPFRYVRVFRWVFSRKRTDEFVRPLSFADVHFGIRSNGQLSRVTQHYNVNWRKMYTKKERLHIVIHPTRWTRD